MRVWGSAIALALCALGAALVAAPASAGSHYTFKHFAVTKGTAGSSGSTEVRRCAAGLAGDWRLYSQFEIESVGSSKPKYQFVVFDITATMPITTKFRSVEDVDVSWHARLPKDPSEAAFVSENYERIAQGQADFYEGISVRWLPAQAKLHIVHEGLNYGSYPQLPPGEFFTPFKPKPGCAP